MVLLGAGGVGKTTVSAASALHAARQGRRTLVLTIDPAKRLADALGIPLGNEVREVRPNLHAQMLDTKQALDDLVATYAEDTATLQSVMESRFYDQLSDAFAGSQEFVAMGALYELLEEGRWDTVVVDTPPSKHAVDFLDVNQRLINVFESGVMKYLFKPTRFLRLGGGYMTKSLARWTSSRYLEEVSDFVVTFDDMFLDMEDRVRHMQEILMDPERTGVNLVTSADEGSVPTTLGLHREVTEDLGLHVDACIVNRVLEPLDHAHRIERIRPDGPARPRVLELLATDHGAEAATRFLDDAATATDLYQAVAKRHAQHVHVLDDAIPAPVHHVPALRESVHDLDGLERVRASLFPEP